MDGDEKKLKRAVYHLWTFTTSKLISQFGSSVYNFAISFYILQITGSAANFAMNLVCSILPRALVAPLAGYVADRYPRKRTVILSQVFTVLAVLGLLIVTLTFGLSLAAIYTTTALISLTTVFSGVAFTSSITGLVDESRIQKATSMNQMSISLASVGGPAIGGILYGLVNIPIFLVIYMIASTIALLLESTMDFTLFAKRSESNSDMEEKESIFQSFKAGIAYVKLKPVILALLSATLFINFFFGSFQVGYSYILIEKLKITSQHFGLTEGASALGTLLLAIYLSIRKEIKYPLITGKFGILGLSVGMALSTLPLFISMSYFAMVVYYLVVMFIIGSLFTIINTPIFVMLQKTIDDDFKGRVFSIIETFALALMPLGTIIFGFLYDLLPAQWVMLSSALLIGIIILVLFRPSIIRKAHPETVKTEIENSPSI